MDKSFSIGRINQLTETPMYGDKLNNRYDASTTEYPTGRVCDVLEPDRVDNEINRELSRLSNAVMELSDLCPGIRDTFSPVLRPETKETGLGGNPEQGAGTVIGQAIAESRRKIELNISILRDVLNRREI